MDTKRLVVGQDVWLKSGPYTVQAVRSSAGRGPALRWHVRSYVLGRVRAVAVLASGRQHGTQSAS